jgi:hypothetical protein
MRRNVREVRRTAAFVVAAVVVGLSAAVVVTGLPSQPDASQVRPSDARPSLQVDVAKHLDVGA